MIHRQIHVWFRAQLRYLPVITVFLVVATGIFLADTDQKTVWWRLLERTPFGDKMAHMVLFGLLAATLNSALRYRWMRMANGLFQLGSGVVLIFAWLEEFSQLGFASRTFDPFDLLADIVGVLIANWLAWRKTKK